MIFKTKQDLGWTRYTPRLSYLLLLWFMLKQCCYLYLNFCMTLVLEMKFEFN
ncbi:hypothetical protein Hanom_Chr08g00712541 [Helianthus anomalus]